MSHRAGIGATRRRRPACGDAGKANDGARRYAVIAFELSLIAARP